MNDEAARLVRALGLAPHPEGGWFRETWRGAAIDVPGRGLRATGTAIYFLLADGAVSRLHRLATDEVWHHHRGDPVDLHVFSGDGHRVVRLGDPQAPAPLWQAVAPAGASFGAEVAVPGGWALLGCTLAPGWEPGDFAWADLDALRRRYPAATARIDRLA
jgi:uncharacterized protein